MTEAPTRQQFEQALHEAGLSATASELATRVVVALLSRSAAGPQATPQVLQQRLGQWHRARFPLADQPTVALKAAEELGEVAEAVNALAGINSATANGALSVPAEAADVVIALMVLVDRWHPGVDLLAEVDRKLAVLEDPTSGHRASVRVVVAPTSQESNK